MTEREHKEAILGQKMAQLVAHDYKTNKKLRELKIPDTDWRSIALRGGRPRHGESKQDARIRRGLD
ncbi:MAG: hypothetical protein ACPGXY_01505 [Alphaproteobacteria bacterium]